MTADVIGLGAERERRRNGYCIPRKRKTKPAFFAMYDFDGELFSVKVWAKNDEDFKARVKAIRESLRLPIG